MFHNSKSLSNNNNLPDVGAGRAKKLLKSNKRNKSKNSNRKKLTFSPKSLRNQKKSTSQKYLITVHVLEGPETKPQKYHKANLPSLISKRNSFPKATTNKSIRKIISLVFLQSQNPSIEMHQNNAVGQRKLSKSLCSNLLKKVS